MHGFEITDSRAQKGWPLPHRRKDGPSPTEAQLCIPLLATELGAYVQVLQVIRNSPLDPDGQPAEAAEEALSHWSGSNDDRSDISDMVERTPAPGDQAVPLQHSFTLPEDRMPAVWCSAEHALGLDPASLRAVLGLPWPQPLRHAQRPASSTMHGRAGASPLDACTAIVLAVSSSNGPVVWSTQLTRPRPFEILSYPTTDSLR